MTQRLVSVCCEAPPCDEVTDGAGRCSRCKENAIFETDTWTRDEIASIKADNDYAEWKDVGKLGRIGAWPYTKYF